MANSFTNKIIADGWRNAIFMVTGTLDTSDASLTPVVALTDFTNNDTMQSALVGLRVDRIQHTIGEGLQVQLKWAGTPNDYPIVAVAGQGEENFKLGGGLQPPKSSFGYKGDINLFTTGFGVSNTGTAPQNFTILMDCVKIYRS